MVNFVSTAEMLKGKNNLLGNEICKRKDAKAACKATTPSIVAGKRHYQAIVSPITTNKERMSPKAKYPMMERHIRFDLDYKHSSSLKLPLLLDTLHSVVSDVAVPITAAEPPSPSLLPCPPKCWVGETSRSKVLHKRQCMDVTRSLISHLASSGILAAA